MFLEHEMNRNAWQGTAEAAAIAGVCKPALLHRIEWQTEAPAPVLVSAEILTLVTAPVASGNRLLRMAPDLPPAWFGDLSASIAALRAYPTGRRFPVHDAAEYGYLLGATYRRPVPAGLAPAFGTEHMDLTWDNITAPRFQILDMERWGVAVTGYAAAWLYLSALAVPAIARQVRGAGWRTRHPERPVRPAGGRRAHPAEPHPPARPGRPGGQAPPPHRRLLD